MEGIAVNDLVLVKTYIIEKFELTTLLRHHVVMFSFGRKQFNYLLNQWQLLVVVCSAKLPRLAPSPSFVLLTETFESKKKKKKGLYHLFPNI